MHKYISPIKIHKLWLIWLNKHAFFFFIFSFAYLLFYDFREKTLLIFCCLRSERHRRLLVGFPP
uniref:Uncharacterized protein n=1 Tax=Arundo donax TaxID=35708 RepID=A0A0A9G1G9_ARUDO